MQFKDTTATPQPANIGYGPFLCARRTAGGWCHYAANPLRGYGRG